MTLSQVIKKERCRKEYTAAAMAKLLGISEGKYEEIESSDQEIERSALLLAKLAMELHTPISRLISKTGRSAEARKMPDQCGSLVRDRREQMDISIEKLAGLIGISPAELNTLEGGGTRVERDAPVLLQIAELLDQPLFNLIYPYGLPLAELVDYP